jgi:hypothetical protein
MFGRGHEVWDDLQVVGIVQDAQPVLLSGQPLLHHLDHSGLVLLVLLVEVQHACDGHIVRNEGLLRSRSDPQDGLVLLLIAIGIFHRRLRFANASQSVDGQRLGESDRLRSRQLLMHGFEQILPSGKERVATVGHHPDQWPVAWKSRWL